MVYIFQGPPHEDFNGLLLNSPVQVQQLLEGFRGQLQLLAHLLVIVGNGLFHCSCVLDLGQGQDCILHAGQIPAIDGIDIGLHQGL